MNKVTRKYCPGPAHDAIAACYERIAIIAPKLAGTHCEQRFGLAQPYDAAIIARWCKGFADGVKGPCPVA